MIAEAIDTIITLGWALLAWIVLCAMFATAALYTLTVTVWLACTAVWRGVAAAVAAVQRSRAHIPAPAPQDPSDARTAPPVAPGPPSRPHSHRQSGPQDPGEGFPAPPAPDAPQSRTARPTPSWAQPDKDAA